MPITDVENIKEDQVVSSTIAPWLSVRDSLAAAAFYKSAFGAIETYRLEPPEGGPVLKLSVGGAAGSSPASVSSAAVTPKAPSIPHKVSLSITSRAYVGTAISAGSPAPTPPG